MIDIVDEAFGAANNECVAKHHIPCPCPICQEIVRTMERLEILEHALEMENMSVCPQCGGIDLECGMFHGRCRR